MKVKLVTKTTGALGSEYEGKSIDEIIVGIARLSSSRDVNTLFKEPEKLIRHCLLQGHYSIFEMANLGFEIETSRAIARQILRHSSLRPQEFCIDGGSKIRIKVGASIKEITIENLFKLQEEGKELPQIYYYSISDRKYLTCKIKEVFKNGIKPVYSIQGKNFNIFTTKEHKFYDGFSFKSLEEIANLKINEDNSVLSFKNSFIGTLSITSPKGVKATQIDSITYIGEKETYDLEIDNESHNYIANGVLVHNSQRYQVVPGFEDLELRLQAKNNRQSSTHKLEDKELSKPYKGHTSLKSLIDDHLLETTEIYDILLEEGVARETARLILPELATSKIILNGTIRSWLSFFNQRLHKTAQKEVRDIANAVKDLFILECPIISEGLYNFDNAENVHILDRLILEKYNVYEMCNKN